MSFSAQRLHRADVVELVVVKAVRQLAFTKGLAKIARCVLDRALRCKSEHVLNAVRIDMIRADIVRLGGDDTDIALLGKFFLYHFFDDFRDIHDAQILHAAIENLIFNFFSGRLEQWLVKSAVILDMQVRAQLTAAENRYLALIDRMIGKTVHRDVETLTRAIPAHCRRPKDHPGEVLVGMLKQEGLAQPFVFIIERQRNERMIFRYLRRVTDTVD